MDILLGSGLAYKTHTLKELEELALSLSFAGLEIMPPPSHVPKNEQARDTNYASISHAPVVHARGDLYTKENFRRALDDSVAIAREAHASVVNMHPATLAFGGRQNVIDGIAYIKEIEEKTGITIAYELLIDPNGVHLGRKEYFKQHQAYTSIEDFITDVKTYNLSATLDTCHIGTWGEDPEQYINMLGNNLKHIHFSDFNFTSKEEHLLPGKGNVQLIPFLQTLNTSHPDITLTLEISPRNTEEQVEQDAKKGMEYIQKALEL